MAESKKIKLSENVTLSFLGNETINEVKLYKYDAKIKNVEKTKTIYLEKEASKYDKTILSDYIIRMVEEYDDQDTFFIVSNNNENNEDKDEVNESTGDGSNSSINDSNNSNDTYGDGGTSNSSSGFSENGGLENSSGTKEQGYSDETVELFQDVAKNAGEFDGSNLDAYKFDLNQFITFKSSIDKLKFISIGELPSAKSSLGQALAKASEGGCDEAVGMIETLIAEVDSRDIASAMDAQVRFYEEVDQIQLQQMQRDAQLNFEDTVASFDSTKYIVSKQEYKDGLKNTLYAAYESLADFMNAVQNYNYQVLSSAGRMAFAESSAGLEFYAMTDAEKEALANGEKGKRFAMPNSEIMIHQPLIGGGGLQGQATEIKIHADHLVRTREKLNKFLSERTGKPLDVIEKDTERDNYMTAEEALKYGLIDGIMTKRA